MTTRHPLREEDDERECGCPCHGNKLTSHMGQDCRCVAGRLPANPDAELVIEIHWTDGGLFPQTRGWHWRRVGESWSDRDPSDSETECKKAARKALAP